jgi:GT2 family glycosyltransferase
VNALPALALCLICHDRPDELRTALASAHGFDEIVVLDMASDPPLGRTEGATVLRSDENVGVTAGRNRLVRAAASDVVVFLDDDAVFRGAAHAATIRECFARDPGLGVLAFRIVRASGESRSLEYPFRGKADETGDARPCSYFLGGAAAVRRSAFLAVGGFDDRYRYSTEEIDLSFSLERDGWSLWYEPAVVVEHRPSLHGRALAPRVPASRLRNRLLLVRRHLPWPLAIVHMTAWALRTGAEAVRARAFGSWLRAWRDGAREPVPRQPLSYSLLWEIHRRGGRALW